MMKCPVCGAEMDDTCEFSVPQESAPWLHDYNLMATGKMTHEEHQVMVARWSLHHKEQISTKVYEWSRDIVLRHNW